MFKFKKRIIKSLLSSILIGFLAIGSIGGCETTAPEASFGSTITLLQVPDDVNICGTGLQPALIRALVIDADGLPVNDVAVTFDIFFAGDNSLLIDSDGDGLGDSPVFQVVDNDACGDEECISTDIEDIVSSGALENNPFTDISDDRGIAEAVIILPGFSNILEDTGQVLAAETTITVFSGSATISEDFDLNQDCELDEEEMMAP